MAKPTQDGNSDKIEAKKTCFVIMPISDADGYPDGHFNEVYSELIMPAVSDAGYECALATSTGSAHMIQLEVVTKIATAPLCICDLSTNNPNVLFEYGLRQAFDLPTVLIKDDKTRRIFDLSGFRDIEYDHSLRISNTFAARKKLVKAIRDTVEGAGDGQQVFSLVRLMNLTKAALPQGDVDPKDARFQLLERKLDGLANLVRESTDAKFLPGIPVPRHTDQLIDELFKYNDSIFYSQGGTLFIQSGGNLYLINNMDGLRESAEYKNMPTEVKNMLLARLKDRLPTFYFR